MKKQIILLNIMLLTSMITNSSYNHKSAFRPYKQKPFIYQGVSEAQNEAPIINAETFPVLPRPNNRRTYTKEELLSLKQESQSPIIFYHETKKTSQTGSVDLINDIRAKSRYTKEELLSLKKESQSPIVFFHETKNFPRNSSMPLIKHDTINAELQNQSYPKTLPNTEIVKTMEQLQRNVLFAQTPVGQVPLQYCQQTRDGYVIYLEKKSQRTWLVMFDSKNNAYLVKEIIFY
ncbi:MAG: hypothetical protein UR26_C0001G0180 [candidate division TM6 bacterium GW2011_GWF2_32_72]|nr:MAG: hypothetical protein UR26_C0001G0180 [candidate division TM6 bacterium GW2011_GWF2_32_72]